MDQKQIILAYIKTQILGVIATTNERGNPEAALVAISETDDFEFIFGTSNTTRKYKNLQNNPHVAFVMGHDIEERVTVQVEGIATEAAGEEAERLKDIHLKRIHMQKSLLIIPISAGLRLCRRGCGIQV